MVESLSVLTVDRRHALEEFLLRQAPPPVIPAERLSIGPHQEADLPGASFVRISLGSHEIAQVWCIDKRVARSPFPDAFHEIPSFIRSSTVKPNSQPTGNVTVVANYQRLADVPVSPTSLMFTTSNRNTTQSIAITAFDDTQAEGGEWIDISHRVNGGGFNNTPAEDFTFRLRDNDSYAHADGDSSVRARLR